MTYSYSLISLVLFLLVMEAGRISVLVFSPPLQRLQRARQHATELANIDQCPPRQRWLA
jgi:hypothetical protein